MNNFYRGDSKTWTIRINSTLFLHGTCWVTFKRRLSDDDANAALQKTATFTQDPSDASKVLAVISVTPAETNTLLDAYYFDIQAVSADAQHVKSHVEKVTVLPDVTRTYG